MMKGEVWEADIPEGLGHEQHGRRPAVIFGRVTGGMVVAIPFTTNLGRLNFAYAQPVSPSKSNGPKAHSVALAYRIRAYGRMRMVRQLGSLDNEEIEMLNDQANELLMLAWRSPTVPSPQPFRKCVRLMKIFMSYSVIVFYDDQMTNGNIQEQLDALRSEVRALGNSIVGIKREDFARAYSEQIRSILLEKIDRGLAELGSAAAGSKEECRDRLIDLVDSVIALYQAGSKEAALNVLDEFRSEIANGKAPFNERQFSRLARDIIRQTRSYLELDRLINKPTQSILGAPRAAASPKAILSPVAAEKVLAPLSSSWRMNLLLLLSEDRRSLAELSKELGIQKGHLQFHLKALSNADYIRYDRRTHLYSITGRGSIALDGVAELVGRLEQ